MTIELFSLMLLGIGVGGLFIMMAQLEQKVQRQAEYIVYMDAQLSTTKKELNTLRDSTVQAINTLNHQKEDKRPPTKSM